MSGEGHGEAASLGESALVEALIRTGLCGAGDIPVLARLTGGVSSDIYRVDVAGRTFAIKRALEKLAVAQDWFAPVSRNISEVQWLTFAAGVAPVNVPKVLAHLPDANFFAMEFLPDHPTWKSRLLEGIADDRFAHRVGSVLVRIHQASAGRDDVALQFANDHAFHSLRMGPYLEATAASHPDLADHLFGLSRSTLATHRALVHGDVSPKNILQAGDEPILLDAECAWYGDPAFDMAFCLNHLLLKCAHRPQATPDFMRSFSALAEAYLEQVDWEPRADVERRIARLLPALTLARIDGKSQVEYLTDEGVRARVRESARRLIRRGPSSLTDIHDAWPGLLEAEGST